MSAKMIVEFRRKPSRARQMAAKRERDAYLDRIVQEELKRAWFAFDPASRSAGIATFRDGKLVV